MDFTYTTDVLPDNERLSARVTARDAKFNMAANPCLDQVAKILTERKHGVPYKKEVPRNQIICLLTLTGLAYSVCYVSTATHTFNVRYRLERRKFMLSKYYADLLRGNP